MKIKAVILLVGYFLFCHYSVIARNMTLGYVDFPPYEFEENGKPQGVLVAIVKTIFNKAGIQLELRFLPFKRAYEDTKRGVIDGLFNFYKTKERLDFFDYTDPIIKNPLVIFVRKDSILEFKKIEDLRGLYIGVMRGYSYGTNFDNCSLFKRNKANSHEACFKRLVYGRTDAYPCDKLVGINVAIKNNYMTELKILSTPLKTMDGHIGFTKGKHTDVIKKINSVIAEMIKNGDIDGMINQYMDKNL